ncbi:MAG TPA: hypothetical protein VHK67_02585 [Rhabdochlamydiaceae bacterium]|jgi:hypothetical protein|nr:hypothetical protein [Rhabdochlamydiaceae bacterium]
MKLEAKLRSLQPSQIVAEIDTLLKTATVTISWWGERLVTIQSYEGSVHIDVLARKYLQSNVFPENLAATKESELPSLEDRLKCDALCDKVKNLYSQSDAVIKSTWIQWLVVWIREFNSPYDNTADIIRQNGLFYLCASAGLRNACFEFPKEVFIKLFPNENPVFGYVTHLKQGELKHFPAQSFKVMTGDFVDESKLEKVEVVWTRTFKNIPHFEGGSNVPGLMKTETVKKFFPEQNLKTDFTLHQNDHLKLIEWLVTTREVVEKALKTSKTT